MMLVSGDGPLYYLCVYWYVLVWTVHTCLLSYCKSKHSTPKVITGHYIITLCSEFGQTIEVGYSSSLLLLCAHDMIQCTYIYNINISMKFSYFHFRWQWCLHNSRSNHWSNYRTVTSHYHHHLLFCDKERYVYCKCVLHVFDICINITIIFCIILYNSISWKYCILLAISFTVKYSSCFTSTFIPWKNIHGYKLLQAFIVFTCENLPKNFLWRKSTKNVKVFHCK